MSFPADRFAEVDLMGKCRIAVQVIGVASILDLSESCQSGLALLTVLLGFLGPSLSIFVPQSRMALFVLEA